MNPITFYQVAHLTDDEVKSQFVIRKKEFDRVISEVRRDDMKGSIQHYIFIGQRGSGKSTLLRRIQAEINPDEVLSEKLVAIYLSEEQAGIYRLHDLWDRVCHELKEKGFEVEEVRWVTYEKDLIGFAKALYTAMQKALTKKGKKLVLLLDNIDRIFDSIKISDAHLFREQLMNYKDVRIIGGSTRLSEHFWKYDQPFYEFFQIIPLEPMMESDLEELLLFWSDFLQEPDLKRFVENNPGKLNAVRILSDGMPRTMLSLMELFLNKPDQHGYEYLRYILDRATPVYQERLGNLSPMQQKVALELSFFWDAAMVKELSRAAHVDSKTLSALLGQLVEMQIVEKIKGTGKNFLYRLKERFFNLWLIMTQGGPRQKSQVKWLTVFLETWYEANELKTIYSDFSSQLADGKISPDRAVLMTKALAHSKYLSVSERDALLEQTKTLIGNQKEQLEFLPPKAGDVFNKVIELIKQHRLEEAQKELDSIEQKDNLKLSLQGGIYHAIGNYQEAEKYYLMAIDNGDVIANYNLAVLYYETQQNTKAEEYYLLAIKKGNRNAIYNLALLYHSMNLKLKAEKYYLMAIEKGIVEAMNNLGYIYHNTNKYLEAEKYYLMAIDNGELNALNNLANLYRDTSRNEDAEKYYLLSIHKGFTTSLNNLATLYSKSNRIIEAEKYLLMAIDKGNIDAMFNLGNLYRDLNRNDEAQKFFLMAINKGDIEAMNNLAILYNKTNRNHEAEKYYLMAIKNGYTKAMFNLALMYYSENQKAEQAYSLIVKCNASEQSNLDSTSFQRVIEVWSGKQESLESVDELLRMIVEKKDIGVLKNFIGEILVHHQKNIIWQWFHHPEFGQTLIDMAKPLYFVTAKLLNSKETQNELLAQAPELKETVDAIYDYTIERQQFYYGKGK